MTIWKVRREGWEDRRKVLCCSLSLSHQEVDSTPLSNPHLLCSSFPFRLFKTSYKSQWLVSNLNCPCIKTYVALQNDCHHHHHSAAICSFVLTLNALALSPPLPDPFLVTFSQDRIKEVSPFSCCFMPPPPGSMLDSPISSSSLPSHYLYSFSACLKHD